MTGLLRYFRGLGAGRITLWCYLLWYLATVWFRFDPTPAIWLNSLGISAVVGLALLLSVGPAGGRRDRWQIFRLFLMPFCVSSFSSLIKGHGYWLVFPADPRELLASLALCLAFLAFVLGLRRLMPAAAGQGL